MHCIASHSNACFSTLLPVDDLTLDKGSLDRKWQDAENALKKSRDEGTEQKQAIAELTKSAEARLLAMTEQRDRLTTELSAVKRELAENKSSYDTKLDDTDTTLRREIGSLKKQLTDSQQGREDAIRDMEISLKKANAECAAVQKQLNDLQTTADKRQDELQNQLDKESEALRVLSAELTVKFRILLIPFLTKLPSSHNT